MSRLTTALAALEVDHELSPVTGWTRRHHEVLADESLLAVRPYASPGGALLQLPGPVPLGGPVSSGLEGFARTFLAAGFRLATAEGDPYDHAGFAARGIATGTDPAAADRWPRLDEVLQPRVEAAMLAIALHESRPRVWDLLDSAVQERVIAWMSGAIGPTYQNNNWRWFQNITQAFLRSVGVEVEQDRIDENIAFLDSCWLGDGWYSDGRPDGRNGNVDWYNAWAMLIFPLWYCRISGAAAPAGLLETSRQRLADYLPTGARLFGDDGAPLYQGRSMIYRFATTTALWSGPVFDVNALDPGSVRRIGSAAAKWFVDAGAYDDNGLLTIGWRGPYEAMRQNYSGPGSTYWANLGLAGLVLPAEHAVWTATETPQAEPGTEAIRPVGWIGGRHAGIVTVLNHGVDHSGAGGGKEDPNYCRYAYSSAAAPVVAPDPRPDDCVLDNQVALHTADGWSHRRPITLVSVQDDRATSRQAFTLLGDDGPVVGPAVTVTGLWHAGVEVRVITIDDDHEWLAGARLVVSGFAVPSDDDLVSAVTPLLGDFESGTSHHPDNPYDKDLVVPWVSITGPRAGVPYVVALGLGRSPIAAPTAVVDADAVRITWADGTTTTVPLVRPTT